MQGYSIIKNVYLLLEGVPSSCLLSLSADEIKSVNNS